jgi:hypothetical protein
VAYAEKEKNRLPRLLRLLRWELPDRGQKALI